MNFSEFSSVFFFFFKEQNIAYKSLGQKLFSVLTSVSCLNQKSHVVVSG